MIKISDLFKGSDELASLLPNILFDSEILSRNTIEGMHATRFSGKGEDFWQFKEYRQGDNIASIDWRKSAALNKILVKQKENETAKTIYFYYDRTKSMYFKSDKNFRSKYYISILLTLTLSRIFLKNRENVFHFKSKKNLIKCSNDLSSFTKNFLYEDNSNNYPDTSLILDNSICFILSDFFFDFNLVKKFLIKLKKKNVRGFLIQVLDPMEINFTIKENLILNDMETGANLKIDDSKSFKLLYETRLKNLQKNLFKLSKNTNWNFLMHNTNANIKIILLEIFKNIIIKKK